MATRKLTRKQACAALGDMPDRTFARLVTEGLPRDGDGMRARFPWPEIHVWLLERERKKARDAARPTDTSLLEAERREAVAKADLKELELAERRGELMTVVEGRQWFAEACARVRSKLVNGPRQVAIRVTGGTIPDREAQARPVFDEIMSELSAADDVPDGEEAA